MIITNSTQNTDGTYRVQYTTQEFVHGVSFDSINFEIDQTEFTTRRKETLADLDAQKQGTVTFVFYNDFREGDLSKLEAIVQGHTAKTFVAPKIQTISDITKEPDGRALFALSPYPPGYGTFFSGRADSAPTEQNFSGGLGDGKPFQVKHPGGGGTVQEDYIFRENIRINDAKTAFGDLSPEGEMLSTRNNISPDATKQSYSTYILTPGNPAVEDNVTGNVRAVTLPSGSDVWMPCLSEEATHKVILDTEINGFYVKGNTSPLTATGKTGFWQMDEKTGVVSPVINTNNPDGWYHLYIAPAEFYYMKNMHFIGISGHVDIEVPKTELFHHSWVQRYEVYNDTPNGIWIATNVMIARRNLTYAAPIISYDHPLVSLLTG